MNGVIHLENVSVSQGGRLLLDSVTLTVPSGAFVAVLGPNGAGKTSLLRLIDGEIPASAGTRGVLGADPSGLDWRAAARWRRRIGVMPQFTDRPEAVPLSVREVVAISQVAKEGSDDSTRVDHWIERLGLLALADRPYGRLSGGEQRRVHLARVFSQEPELVLLDEPAGHLDFPAREDLVDLLTGLWRESGSTVVLVTHDLGQLPPELTQVVLMREGRVVAQGAPESVLSPGPLERALGQAVETIRHRGRWLAAMEGRHG